jgi:hypothetical protein
VIFGHSKYKHKSSYSSVFIKKGGKVKEEMKYAGSGGGATTLELPKANMSNDYVHFGSMT